MDTKDAYQTIAKTGESLYKEKGSKFLGFAFHTESEEQVKEKLEQLKKTYHDARHWCYAYILGEDAAQIRAYDDGEPANSAGTPILNQIKSKNLTYCLVVVVRYFGGTKLGVSGLVNAYKTAAQEALEHAKTERVTLRKWLHITYDYNATAEVARLLGQLDIKMGEQQFLEKCTATIGLRFHEYEPFLIEAALISGLLVEPIDQIK